MSFVHMSHMIFPYSTCRGTISNC